MTSRLYETPSFAAFSHYNFIVINYILRKMFAAADIFEDLTSRFDKILTKEMTAEVHNSKKIACSAQFDKHNFYYAYVA